MDADFLVLKTDVPTLLILRDTLKYNLDISIHDAHLLFEGRSEPLIIRNCSLIYTWEPEDSHFPLFTGSDLRNIYRTFGHPMLKATINLLKRASGKAVPTDTKQAIAEISQECETCKLNETALTL